MERTRSPFRRDPGPAEAAAPPSPGRRRLLAGGAGLAAVLAVGGPGRAAEGAASMEEAARELARRSEGAPFRDLVPPSPAPPRTSAAAGPASVTAIAAPAPFDTATEIEVAGPGGVVALEPGGARIDVAAAGSGLSTSLRFRGATVFDLAGPGQAFGAAARAMALRVADPAGEETPVFRLLRIAAAPGGAGIVAEGLVDGPSATAAVVFGLDAGRPGLVDVDVSVFPRRDLRSVGIGAISGTYLHAPGDGRAVDDVRPAVHEAEALWMWNGAGERIWRPLSNPASLGLSAFTDAAPAAFGLVQRNRSPARFLDPAGAWERRPSLVVRPRGDWGRGFVTLVEIPSRSEENDNAIVFWQPDSPLPAGGPHRFAWRLEAVDAPAGGDEAARIEEVRSGGVAAADGAEARRYVVIYRMTGGGGPDVGVARSAVRADPATVGEGAVYPLDGGRLASSFVIRRPAGVPVDFRADLYFDRAPPAEVLLDRWR